MNHAIFLSEPVMQIPMRLLGWAGDEKGELMASLDAHHDTASHQVVAVLDAFVTPDALEKMGERLHPEWLPHGETVKAGGDPGETDEIARDIFHSWVARVRQSVPEVK